MSNATAVAPERATKAPSRVKAAPATTAADTTAPDVPETASITEDEALVASTLAGQLRAIYDMHSMQMSLNGSELLHTAADDLEAPQDCERAMHKAAAVVYGAIAVERADRPGSPVIAHLEVVYQSLRTASTGYSFEEAGCEAMAEGIRAGQRQFRDRPAPPIRRVEADSEDMGRSALTRKQLLCVLEAAASKLSTVENILMLAKTEAEPFALAGLIDAAQALTTHCGGMVDSAAGGTVIGGHDRWNFGPNFADLGKAGEA